MKFSKLIILGLTFVVFSLSSKAAAPLEDRYFFDDSVIIRVPQNFNKAPQELIETRFTDENNRPEFVLTDSDQLATLALSIADNVGDRETIIHFYRDIKNSIRAQHPKHQFLKTDVIRNRTLAIVEVIMPNSEGNEVYNMMAFRYVGERFFFLNFSCPKEEMDKWQNTAREIAETVKVN